MKPMVSSSFSDIFERMLKVGRFKNGSEMAKALGVTPQAISNYKKKGELSAGFVLKFAGLHNVSVDWLLTGVGERVRPAGQRLSSSICTIAIVETDGALGLFNGAGPSAHVPAGPGTKGMPQLGNAVLSPDEVVYVGKLLKVFRAPEGLGIAEVKATIDAFLKAAYSAVRPSER